MVRGMGGVWLRGCRSGVSGLPGVRSACDDSDDEHDWRLGLRDYNRGICLKLTRLWRVVREAAPRIDSSSREWGKGGPAPPITPRGLPAPCGDHPLKDYET